MYDMLINRFEANYGVDFRNFITVHLNKTEHSVYKTNIWKMQL